MSTSESQDTINQRLKILIEALRMNPRSFSLKYGVSEGTTRNYLDRGSVPNAEYIAKLIRSVENLSAEWILLGEGTIFRAISKPVGVYQKNSGSNVIGQNTGIGTVTQTHNEGVAATECAQQLEMARREIELLKGQLTDKERIIKLLERHMPS